MRSKNKNPYFSPPLIIIIAIALIVAIIAKFTATSPQKENNDLYNITGTLEYYDDPDSKENEESICTKPDQLFKTLDKPNYGFGLQGARWLRFKVERDQLKSADLYLHHGFTRVESFQVFFRHQDSPPKCIAADQEKSRATGPVFHLPTSGDEKTLIYFVKLEPHNHALNTNIHLSTASGAIDHVENHILVSGLFFGSIIALIGYNALLCILLRSRPHLYYVYYLSSLLLTFFYLDGFASIAIRNINETWDKFFVACMFTLIHGMSLLGRKILQLKQNHRTSNTILVFLEYLLMASAAACFIIPIGSHSKIFHPLMLTTTFMLVVSSVRSFRTGSAPARIYAIAWSIFVTALISYSLVHLNLLPKNWLFENAVKIAAVVEATLFSFALALRIKLAEQEKNAAIDQSTRRERQLLESKQAELEARVSERTASLQASLEARRMMLANVSHELRAPVNALSLLLDTPAFHQAQGGEGGATQQGDQQQALAQARNISAHLASLIENLLKLEVDAQRLSNAPSTTEQGVAVDLTPAQAFDLEATLLAIAAMVSPLQWHHDTEFEVDVAACRGYWVAADETALRRILVNLLSNAFKFTSAGKVLLKAVIDVPPTTLPASDTSLTLHLLIRDTGCGIAPAMQTQIFEPFVTTVGPHAGHTGTGLGLPLARQLARQLGGDLKLLDSTPTRGSTFECTLRLRQVAAPEPLKARPHQPLVQTLESPRGLRILVAEDCPVTAQALECILRGLHHTVTQVSDFSGLTAQLNRLSLASFDLALLDHRLPGGSGLEFARRCRALEQGAQDTTTARRRLPIVLMTGDVTPEVIAEAESLCDDLISKPTTAQRLEHLLGRGPAPADPLGTEAIGDSHTAHHLTEAIHQGAPPTARLSDNALIRQYEHLVDPHRLLTLLRHGATHEDLLSMCDQFAQSVHAAIQELDDLPTRVSHTPTPTSATGSSADAVIHRVCSGCVTMGAIELAAQFRRWPQASVDSIATSFHATQQALDELVRQLAHRRVAAP